MSQPTTSAAIWMTPGNSSPPPSHIIAADKMTVSMMKRAIPYRSIAAMVAA
jgi:hypothetical protein